MSLLSRFGVLAKILVVIGLLSVVAIGITLLGISSLNQISQQTDLVGKTGNQATLLARINTNVLAIDRAELLIASDPRPETKREARSEIETETKTLKQRLDDMGKLITSADSKNRLAEIEKGISDYSRELDVVYQAADGVQNFQMTQELEKLHAAVLTSDKQADSLRGKIRSLIEVYDKRVDEVTQEAEAEHTHVSMLMTVLATVGILIGLLFGFMIGQYGIARPIAALVVELKKLAEGDFNIALPWASRKDEIGQIAAAAEAVVDQVGTILANIKTTAQDVTSASSEISTSTTDLSQRTEEQAASLEETSASMQELTATVKKNAENAQQADQFSAETRTVAERGGEVVAKAVEAMARIEDSSRKISDIIGVIDEIARQTNLLALNAAVEAARAGEAGRGFAVVATEVRSLAQRSSQAAKDIKELITNSSGQVKDGVDLVNRTGTSLTEIVASIKKVAGIVSDIAAASAEQATGLEQVNKALAQMDEVTQQNSALVQENAATAKTLEHQAIAMDERVSFFRLDDDAESAEVVRAPEKAPGRRPGAAPVARTKPTAGAPKPRAGATAAARPAVAAAARGPVGRMQAALATAIKDDPDWKEF